MKYAFVTLIIGFLAVAGQSDYAEQEGRYADYCEMVELYKSSGGEHGWPPYQGECNEH